MVASAGKPLEGREAVGDVMEALLVNREDHHLRCAEDARIVERPPPLAVPGSLDVRVMRCMRTRRTPRVTGSARSFAMEILRCALHVRDRVALGLVAHRAAITSTLQVRHRSGWKGRRTRARGPRV